MEKQHGLAYKNKPLLSQTTAQVLYVLYLSAGNAQLPSSPAVTQVSWESNNTGTVCTLPVSRQCPVAIQSCSDTGKLRKQQHGYCTLPVSRQCPVAIQSGSDTGDFHFMPAGHLLLAGQARRPQSQWPIQTCSGQASFFVCGHGQHSVRVASQRGQHVGLKQAQHHGMV